MLKLFEDSLVGFSVQDIRDLIICLNQKPSQKCWLKFREINILEKAFGSDKSSNLLYLERYSQ